VLAIEECASSPPHAVRRATNWDASRLTVTITGGGGLGDSQVQFYDMASAGDGGVRLPGRSRFRSRPSCFERFGGRMTYRPAVPGKWLQITLPSTTSAGCSDAESETTHQTRRFAGC